MVKPIALPANFPGVVAWDVPSITPREPDSRRVFTPLQEPDLNVPGSRNSDDILSFATISSGEPEDGLPVPDFGKTGGD